MLRWGSQSDLGMREGFLEEVVFTYTEFQGGARISRGEPDKEKGWMERPALAAWATHVPPYES